MAELLESGIAVAELVDRDHPIPLDTDCVVAFIGRARSGPLHRAVEIASTQEFVRTFGSAWSASLLPDAIDQFFRHGGRRAVVVRVANGAIGAQLVLPATRGALTLVACNPGAGEQLRVAVDYDGIDAPQNPDLFNLTIQRLGGPGSRVTDQEIFRRVSIDADARDFVGDELERSRLVRVGGTLPESPPRPTAGSDGTGERSGYVGLRRPGSDGAVLTDYDLVGSREAGTGLFALDVVEQIDFLYAPPNDHRSNFGPVYYAAAERYCARRNALLLVDPPVGVGSRRRPAVLEPMIADLGSSHVLTYFPRPEQKGSSESPVPVAAALAGLLARRSDAGDVAAGFSDTDAALTRDFFVPGDEPAANESVCLHAGVNLLAPRPDGRLRPSLSVTTARGLYDDVGRLEVARLVMYVRRALESGTRWVVFGKPGHVLWRRLELQVEDFLGQLARAGLLDASGRKFVHCNAVTNAAVAERVREVHFLAGFTPRQMTSPIVLSVTQAPRGATSARAAFVADLSEKG